MLSGCKPQYCKTVRYTWLYTCDCKAFGSDTRFGDLKIGAGIEPCMQLGYKILMNKKGAMVRDSNSLQSSCKADAALVDHVRLRSCFISPSIPVAPNARFSVPPMHVTGRTRGESNPTVTQLPPGTSASKSTTEATLFSWGSASKWSVLKRPPPGPPILTSFAKSNLSQA